MKKLIVFILIFHCLNAGRSQQLTPSVFTCAGDYLAGQNYNLSITIGEPITETLANSGNLLTTGFEQPGSGSRLLGQVTYLNNASTPLNNTTVMLKQGGVTMYQAVTDQTGHYIVSGLAPGSYVINSSSSKPWGGGNSIDALAVMRHFVGITYLTGLKLAAADVDATGFVNAQDALAIMRRFVGMQSSFASGDWAFEKPAVTIPGNGDVTQNYKGLCYGDVNGDYTPPARVSPTLFLEKKEVREVPGGHTFFIPLTVQEETELGAVSLVIRLSENLNVEGIIPPGSIMLCRGAQEPGMSGDGGHERLLYTIKNGELRIAWYKLGGVSLKAGDTLVTILAKPGENLSGQELALELSPESGLGTADAQPIEGKVLAAERYAIANQGLYVGDNQPNPFSTKTTIEYYLPEAGELGLAVYDYLGNLIIRRDLGKTVQGHHQYVFDGTGLADGVYFFRVAFRGHGESAIVMKRMVYSKGL